MNIYSSKKVVAIGGGHGLGRMLAALKDFGSNATGIVATTDNGGSTGRIRDCQGGIAWGDTCYANFELSGLTRTPPTEQLFEGVIQTIQHEIEQGRTPQLTVKQTLETPVEELIASAIVKDDAGSSTSAAAEEAKNVENWKNVITAKRVLAF